MMYSKLEAAGKNLKGVKRIIYNLAWNFANNYDNYHKGRFYNCFMTASCTAAGGRIWAATRC